MTALPYLLLAGAAGALALLGRAALLDLQGDLTGAQLRWLQARLPLVIALLSIAIWEFCYGAELLTVSEAGSIAWHRAAYLGTCALPPAFLWSVASATRRGNSLADRWIAVLWVLPAISIGFVVTEEAVFWAPNGLLAAGPYSAIDTIRGPWFWVHTSFSYACILIGTVSVLRVYATTWRARKREAFAVVAGVAAPWAANGLHLFLGVGQSIDITPLALVPTAILLDWLVRQNRLKAILPIAHAAILDQMDDCLFIVDAAGQIVSTNRSAREVLSARGSSESLLVTEAWPELAMLATRAPNQGVLSAPDVAGEARHFDARVSLIADSAGLHAIAMRDVTEQIVAEALLSMRASRDELTGLCNRSHFREAVASIFEGDGSGIHALLLFDLDDFKTANDTLGHAAGDVLLRQVGEALSAGIRGRDVCARLDPEASPSELARLGGDEFAILVTGLRKAEDAGFIAERLLRHIEEQQKRWNVRASVGIAMTPADAASPDALFQAADAALYHSKSQGGSRIAFFRPHFNVAAERRHLVERRLAEIRGGAGLRLCFQPKVEVGTHRLVGLEALVRWTDEELGNVSPSEFIPVAERTGAIRGIGRWVIEETCRQILLWQDQGLRPPPVAVNVACPQLRDRDFYEHLTSTLQAHHLPPEVMEVEITESTLLSQDPDTIQVLQELRYIGIRVWLDDFGTGYSSLSYLNSFQLDGLKLDQSFVRDIDTDRRAQSIAVGVVTIARHLGLSIVAEGVETDAERKYIAMLDADQIQGYLFSKPLEADEAGGAIKAVFIPPSSMDHRDPD